MFRAANNLVTSDEKNLLLVYILLFCIPDRPARIKTHIISKIK
jgi:hypothetical protein